MSFQQKVLTKVKNYSVVAAGRSSIYPENSDSDIKSKSDSRTKMWVSDLYRLTKTKIWVDLGDYVFTTLGEIRFFISVVPFQLFYFLEFDLRFCGHFMHFLLLFTVQINNFACGTQ